MRLGQRFLARGESVVASTGILLAAILLGAVAASAWWTLRTQRDSAAAAQLSQARAVGALLAQSAEVMLAQNDLSPVRRLVVDAARSHNLTRCRIVLPGDKIVADADPASINLQQLPARWSPTDPAVVPATDDDGVERFSLVIPNRGRAMLEVVAALPPRPPMFWEAQAGIGAIGAAAMVLFLLVYRRMRARLQSLGAIREALVALGAGEHHAAALTVSPDLGAEADAWNRMLQQNEELRQQVVVGRTQQALSPKRGDKGDLESAFDALSQGLLVVDQALHIRHANGAAAVFLRGERDKMIGGTVDQLITDAKVLDSIRQGVSGTARRRTTIETERRDEHGTGVLRFSVRPMRREDAAAAVVVIEDITQQRVAEKARDAFLAQAAHELRTPLTNIRLYVETALETSEDNVAERSKCLNVINQEARRLERIVGDVLSVAEIEAGSLKISKDDVRLDALFEQLTADYQAAVREKTITLAFNLPPKLPVIHGDRDKITMALHNLLGNAIKYTPAGGKVSVNVEVHKGQLVVEVADSGIGIAKEDLERLFERFYRAKDPRVAKIKGSGLGLALAREVARLHGGDIAVTSEINKGSRFTLTLPAPQAT